MASRTSTRRRFCAHKPALAPVSAHGEQVIPSIRGDRTAKARSPRELGELAPTTA